MRLLALALASLCFVVASPAAYAQEREPASAQTAWRLLDYIGVDYPGAVAGGKIISAAEYAEMTEFAAQVETRIAALPDRPTKAELLRRAKQLRAAIDRKSSGEEIAGLSRSLSNDLLKAYPTALAPTTPPDLALGERLYQQQCAACHGTSGRADGPAAAGMDPPPIAFADLARARERSVFGLYQVIHQGLDGTAMTSFAHLPNDEQWALAFYVGRFAFTDEDAARGEKLWKSDASLRARFPNLQALSQMTPSALAKEIGEEKAIALTAFLRRHPDAVAAKPGAATLDITRSRLLESLAAYQQGDRRKATDLALAAYLDGFEPIEPILKARDAALMQRIELAMGKLRASIAAGAPVSDVRAQIATINGLIDQAERTVSPDQASNGSSFAGAFTILVREGLEALLIVVAMIAFLRKAERNDVLPYVHGGWVAALAAGGLTWLAATSIITISGASRELTEGFGSLIAALVLISVGLWMHGKAQADAWQKYIRERLSAALSKQSAWFLFFLAFLVVYREVFETILFFVAMWSQGGRMGMLAGAGAAVIVLAGIAWLLLNYSRRLPISQFFSLSSILMAILAVVLTGKGVAALQEAGMLGVQPLGGAPRIEILGLYPTVLGVLAQLTALVVLVVGFWYTARRSKLAV
ncbi:MAG: cytochrome c/FTR1 family iron permease [Rhizorhabdus sp.]|uniref:cytochrome c/FTR1 family iron permease n=1 Tax=Rhizorhabdus sp. TaxID=1968843 RepID=UPI001B774677|nr:cytochrome c/FTR1 family iron permease [Rhizorhabdus sp.]MBP8231228.1 cytochrome c/FTR1 family iron permease [Rhizorhabdus sp.]